MNLEYLQHLEHVDPLEQIGEECENVAGLVSASTSTEDWSAGQEPLMARSVPSCELGQSPTRGNISKKFQRCKKSPKGKAEDSSCMI